MAKKLFENGDVWTPEMANSIYGQGADGGHKHDGKDEDGHCGKIGAGEIGNDVKSALSFIGKIDMYAGTDTPYGYLKCDGLAVPSDNIYDAFRSWIDSNAKYLKIDGAYHTPNLSGRTAIGDGQGKDTNDETQYFNTGEFGGEYAHKLSAEETARHAHGSSFSQIYGSGEGYLLGLNSRNENQADTVFNALADVANSLWKKNADGGVTRDIGDKPHNNIQPYAVVNYIIRVI